jgi:FAR-17a/AIG1-like protein
MHSVLYSTVTCYPFVITLAFWTLISAYPHTKALRTPPMQWSNITFHCLNSIFALFEVFFSSVHIQPRSHVIFILLFMLLYIGMAYMIHLTAHFYVYDFLDEGLFGWLTLAFGTGIGAVAATTFFVVQGLVWVKRFVGLGGVKGVRRETRMLDEDIQAVPLRRLGQGGYTLEKRTGR